MGHIFLGLTPPSLGMSPLQGSLVRMSITMVFALLRNAAIPRCIMTPFPVSRTHPKRSLRCSGENLAKWISIYPGKSYPNKFESVNRLRQLLALHHGFQLFHPLWSVHLLHHFLHILKLAHEPVHFCDRSAAAFGNP